MCPAVLAGDEQLAVEAITQRRTLRLPSAQYIESGGDEFECWRCHEHAAVEYGLPVVLGLQSH